MADIQLDSPSISAQGTLDGLFGTANQAFDLWSRWSDKKIDNVERKAAIPPSVSAPSPKINDGFQMTSKTWTIAVVIVGVLGLFFVLRRK